MLIVIAVLLGGCAYSPYQVVLRPDLKVSDPVNIFSAKSVSIVVSDQRDRLILGSRGGVYGETASIVLADSFSAAIRDSLGAAITQQGGSVVAVGDVDIGLTVIIQKLLYTPSKRSFPQDVKIESILLSEVAVGGAVYKGRYVSVESRKFVSPPGEGHLSEIVNFAVEKTLLRILEDQRMHAFVARAEQR